MTPASCPLTTVCVLWAVCTYSHTHTHTTNRNNFLSCRPAKPNHLNNRNQWACPWYIIIHGGSREATPATGKSLHVKGTRVSSPSWELPSSIGLKVTIPILGYPFYFAEFQAECLTFQWLTSGLPILKPRTLVNPSHPSLLTEDLPVWHMNGAASLSCLHVVLFVHQIQAQATWFF